MTFYRTYRFCRKLFTFVAVILAMPLAAMACPLCNSPTGQQVRAGIVDDGFLGTLLAVISPFPVLLLVLAAYHYGIPKFGRRSKTK